MNWPFWCVLGWVLFAFALTNYISAVRDFWRISAAFDKLEAMVRRAWDREEKYKSLLEDDKSEDWKHGRN